MAIAAWADQSPWVKLMANVANKFPESGKLGKIKRHREDPMPCVLRQ
jgi:hypothetical protein